MTREKLKREAKEYADKYGKSNFDLWDTARFAYYQGAEPREKQIQIDAEQIRALQKQNGELTDRVKELEAQIEKMKCCENCGWFYLQQHWRESEEINESRMFHCGTCGNKNNWKLKEIKEK